MNRHPLCMPRVPAFPSFSDAAEQQIDTAVLRLVDLFARQTARELVADAPDAKETPHAAQDPQED